MYEYSRNTEILLVSTKLIPPSPHTHPVEFSLKVKLKLFVSEKKFTCNPPSKYQLVLPNLIHLEHFIIVNGGVVQLSQILFLLLLK